MPPVTNSPDPASSQPGPDAVVAKAPRLTLKRFIVIALATIVLSGAAVVAYFVISIGGVLGSFADKCTQGSDLATQAAPRLEAKLNSLNIGNDSAVKATSSKYGDCIDASSFTAEARVAYIVPSLPLLDVHQVLEARLRKLGFVPAKAIGINTIQQISDKVTASETYTAQGQPALNVSYILTPHDPNACSQDALGGTATYDQCFATYKAGYTDMSKLKITSYTVTVSQEFPSQ